MNWNKVVLGLTLLVCTESQPSVEVKGALDPAQADILSAYSTEQGKSPLEKKKIRAEDQSIPVAWSKVTEWRVQKI